MMLYFRALPGCVCHWLGPKHVGQLANYIGRQYDRETKQHRAINEAVQVQAETPDGRRCALFCSRGELWAADPKTAAFCGVPFVELEQDADGEWQPIPQTKHAPKASANP